MLSATPLLMDRRSITFAGPIRLSLTCAFSILQTGTRTQAVPCKHAGFCRVRVSAQGLGWGLSADRERHGNGNILQEENVQEAGM